MTERSGGVPESLLYTQEHHWLFTESDGVVRIGITDFGQSELGEIVFLVPPRDGARLTKGERLAEIESTKVMWDLSAPLSGDVIEVNRQLDMNPELLNSDPYGTGWIVRIRPEGAVDFSAFLDAASYDAFIQSQAKEV